MIKVTLSLEQDVWPAFRMACIQRKTSASKEISKILRQQLETWDNQKKELLQCQLKVLGQLLMIGLALLVTAGCAPSPQPPLVSPETEAICAPLLPAVASALTVVERGGSLDVHEVVQMRQWEASCTETGWHLRLTDHLYGTHPPLAAEPDTRTLGERLLDVLVDNHRGGAIVYGTTCQTFRTTGRKGSAYVTNCSTY